MSRPVKDLMIKAYKERLTGSDGVVLINIRGVNAAQNGELRTALAAQGIRVMVVKNRLARQAIKGTSLEPASDLFEGGVAIAFGGESVVNVARAVVKHQEGRDFIEVKGAILEGTVFGPDDVKTLSKYPTREEAIGKLAGAILGPGASLAAALLGPGRKLAGAIKAIEDKNKDAA